MLASAILLAGYPAVAQDADAPAPSEELKLDIGSLLQKLDELPEFGSPPAKDPAFDTSKPVVGFGFQIRDGDVHIAEVLDGSAAKAAGLEVGMIIERINGARLTGFTLQEIAKLIAAIDGELTFDIRDQGDMKLRKAPIEQQGS